MDNDILNKTSTGIASEFLVAGELARRGYNVSLTFGNTKAIDLFIEKNGKLIAIQVKGIQRTKSINWNISLAKLKEKAIFYVLVNLHADTLNTQPEYFILTEEEVTTNFNQTDSGRDYFGYSAALKKDFKNAWHKLDA